MLGYSLRHLQAKRNYTHPEEDTHGAFNQVRNDYQTIPFCVSCVVCRFIFFFSSTVGPAYEGVVGESGKKLRDHKLNNLEATFILLTMQVDRETRQFKCQSRL